MVMNLTSYGKLSGLLCELFGMFSQIWWNSNIYTLLFMSYDGYKFISCALDYKTIITPLKAYVYISITWSIAMMLSLLPLFGWSRYAYNTDQCTCSVDWENNFQSGKLTTMTN